MHLSHTSTWPMSRLTSPRNRPQGYSLFIDMYSTNSLLVPCVQPWPLSPSSRNTRPQTAIADTIRDKIKTSPIYLKRVANQGETPPDSKLVCYTIGSCATHQLALPYALLSSRCFLSFCILDLAVSALMRTWQRKNGRPPSCPSARMGTIRSSTQESRPAKEVPRITCWKVHAFQFIQTDDELFVLKAPLALHYRNCRETLPGCFSFPYFLLACLSRCSKAVFERTPRNLSREAPDQSSMCSSSL